MAAPGSAASSSGATRLEEVINTKTDRSGQGGKGMGGPKTVTTSYSYFANLAVGLCEGSIAFVRRVWADGREIDLTGVTMRVHRGSETQDPDPLIVAKEGLANAPAYRGLAYVVFERLPLGDFGNRVPQFAFEVVRPVDGLNRMIRAVCLIPGGERVRLRHPAGHAGSRPRQDGPREPPSAQAPERRAGVPRRLGGHVPEPQARLPGGELVRERPQGRLLPHRAPGGRDRQDHGRGRLVRCGTDPRGGQARLPRGQLPRLWRHASDESVIRLIKHLKDRDLEVVLYPFVMMDVPSGNGLPDPYGGMGQPAYPWRGRITCHPAPGRPVRRTPRTQPPRRSINGSRTHGATGTSSFTMPVLPGRPAGSTASSWAANWSA
jgi:hypothetical protein